MSIPDAQKLLYSMANRLRQGNWKLRSVITSLFSPTSSQKTCKLSVFIFRALRHPIKNIVDGVTIEKLLCAILNRGFHSDTHLCKSNLIFDDPTPPFCKQEDESFVNFFFIAWLGRKFEPNPLVVLTAHGMSAPPRAIPLLPGFLSFSRQATSDSFLMD